MSYGNCCVVSDIDECKSVVDGKAVTFRKSDVEDLKEKLESYWMTLLWFANIRMMRLIISVRSTDGTGW